MSSWRYALFFHMAIVWGFEIGFKMDDENVLSFGNIFYIAKHGMLILPLGDYNTKVPVVVFYLRVTLWFTRYTWLKKKMVKYHELLIKSAGITRVKSVATLRHELNAFLFLVSTERLCGYRNQIWKWRNRNNCCWRNGIASQRKMKHLDSLIQTLA